MVDNAAAEEFRSLHHTDDVLVLPNAWDAASAVLVERAGARAVATTSAGVAWSVGASDGGALGADRAVEAVERITSAVGVPVSADIEDGYGATLDELDDVVRRIGAAGAAGVNLEDGLRGRLRPVADQVARLARAREAADRSGGLFLNARIDTYLLSDVPHDDLAAATLERAAEYVAAGADGVFVPGLAELGEIAQLAAEITAPLNVMVAHGAPSVAQLSELGVRRVSAGAAIAQAAYGLTRRAAAELLGPGTYAALAAGVEYDDLNALLAQS